MSIHTDRIGEVFNELTVTGYDNGSFYFFKCSCGKDCRISYYEVRKGKTKSCGHIHASRKIPNSVGKSFHKLTAIEELGFNNKNQREYLFRCNCGEEVIRLFKDVSSSKIKSCGCGVVEAVKKSNTTHGMTKTKIYSRYKGMVSRCNYEKHHAYQRYGGRGIKVSNEWLGEDGFEKFYEWAMQNGYSEELSLDRIDNNLGYSPENCRWTDAHTQANNRETSITFKFEGVEKSLMEWANDLELNYDSLWRRIKKYGYTFEDAITLNTDRISKMSKRGSSEGNR